MYGRKEVPLYIQISGKDALRKYTNNENIECVDYDFDKIDMDYLTVSDFTTEDYLFFERIN